MPSDQAKGATTRSPRLHGAHVGADVLDDADELVAHPAAGLGRLQSIVRPEIAAADAGAGDADEGVGRLLDGGVGDVLDPNVAGAEHDCCSHVAHSSTDASRLTVPVVPGTGRPSLGERAGGYAGGVDTRSEMREFLTSRRAKITPEQAGLRTFGGTRRVPGLRREEVALLAGVSVDYYTRLERGNASGASESVLEALARALQLDEAERAHLFDLARAAQPVDARPAPSPTPRVRPSVQRMLDAMTGGAGVRPQRPHGPPRREPSSAARSTRRTSTARTRPPNTARFIFLDARAPDFYADWEQVANDCRRRPARRRRAATRTTATCPTSSASCRRGASSSARGGPRTTSASTTPARSASVTRSSASST